MKQSMKTIKEERVNLQTFGTLRRVKYPTKLEKIVAPPLYVAMEKRSSSLISNASSSQGGRRGAYLW